MLQYITDDLPHPSSKIAHERAQAARYLRVDLGVVAGRVVLHERVPDREQRHGGDVAGEYAELVPARSAPGRTLRRLGRALSRG